MSAPGLTPQLKAFNEELAGICSESPPVSRSKMKAITASGMKAIKMYKHVVQNVEKFISKSKPTYKVTGLYVIDALIRKSQSEFGADKDVYSKRFQKNMLQTFQHLAKSAISSSDKEKCKKIVSLWRKGKTYEESLLDELDSIMLKTSASSKTDAVSTKTENNPPADDAEVLISTILSNPESDMAQNLAKMLGGPQQEQLQQILAKMKQNEQPQNSQNAEIVQDKSPLFDEIENRNSSWPQGPPPLPPLPSAHGKSIPISTIPPPNDWHQHHPPPQPVVPPPGAWPDPPARLPSSPKHDRDYSQFISRDRRRSRSPRKDRSRSRDRDSRRRRRTRSRSRDRDRKRSRSRDSRRDRHRRRSRSRERRSSRRDEISNREKMCLPSTKDGKGCVASRTIWIGNISKGECTEESVKNMIKNVDRVDDIEDITALHSRGCAYVVMKTRAAAFKTLQKLAAKRGREEKRKVDWAINSGLKDAEMAAYFDKAEGAAFIEYSKLPDDIEVLLKWAQGGVIDIESMPEKVQQAIEKDRQNSQSVDMEMDEKEPSSQVPMPNAAALPMLAGMPSMTIPMAMPLAAQMASAQMPIPPPMGQHPLQGAPMMMRHQGLILPQQGMLQHQAGNMPPGGPMMGFIPRERFPRPGGFPPRGPGSMADNHWNGANHGMGGGPRHRGERFQSPRGRFPDDRGFDGGRGGHQRGGHGSWPRGPIQHPRQNFNERDGHQQHAHRDWQNGPDRWGNAHAERNAHHRQDRFRNEPRSPSRGFSRPSPSHSPAAQNPWGGSQSHSNGAAWIPPEIKQEKSSNIENSNSNDENAQTNGWVGETARHSEETQQNVPNSENNINEDVQHLTLKSEINDQLAPPPEPPNENSATTPIHDEPNTNSDATSQNAAAAGESVSAESAAPALEKSIYDPDSLDLNSTVNSSVGEGAGEPSTAESTGEMPPAKSVTAISSENN